MNAKPTTNHLNGTVATIPAELSQQTPSSSEVVPKAVFGCEKERQVIVRNSVTRIILGRTVIVKKSVTRR